MRPLKYIQHNTPIMTDQIIAFCGFIGAGKDSAAAYLVRERGFVKLSFAGLVKDILSVLFSWDRNKLEGLTIEDRAWREQTDPWWSEKLGIPEFSPRYAMRFLGTDLFRNHFHQDIWTLGVERLLDGHKKVVITDCRFPNEIEMLKRHGAVLVHIVRELPVWYTDYKNGLINDVGMHPSDISWIRCGIDFEIDNSGPLAELYKNLSDLV